MNVAKVDVTEQPGESGGDGGALPGLWAAEHSGKTLGASVGARRE